jgi:hypothetical protein
VASPNPEPAMTFKLSGNEFRCSSCGREIASLKNGRFLVAGISDLLAAFRRHVQQFHP